MTIKTKLGSLAIVLALAAMAGQAHAGPNCAPGAARYGAPKAAAAKPAAAPRAALASKPAAPAKADKVAAAETEGQTPASPEAAAPPPKKQAKAAAKPAVAAAPAGQIVNDVVSTVENAGEYTSVSGIAARLAALSAQQKSKAVTE